MTILYFTQCSHECKFIRIIISLPLKIYFWVLLNSLVGNWHVFYSHSLVLRDSAPWFLIFLNIQWPEHWVTFVQNWLFNNIYIVDNIGNTDKISWSRLCLLFLKDWVSQGSGFFCCTRNPPVVPTLHCRMVPF